jgi:hypothetical protein
MLGAFDGGGYQFLREGDALRISGMIGKQT